jgi:hypothetical protein
MANERLPAASRISGERVTLARSLVALIARAHEEGRRGSGGGGIPRAREPRVAFAGRGT